MIEPTEPENQGSIGCHYVVESARKVGLTVDWPPVEGVKYDVELISLHHCLDFIRLARLPKRAPVRLIGGHPLANNPRPVIPFGDALCIGEGEEWIAEALRRLTAKGSIKSLADIPGTILPSAWLPEMPIPAANKVDPLPTHAPYLNRAGDGHRPTWYVEMTRGCPFHCAYCELGWAVKYRRQNRQHLLDCLDKIDRSQSNRITLFAPDEASHPDYPELLERIHDLGLVTAFGSMRLDMVMRGRLPLKPNMLIRVGLDGLTEATRFRVGKRITNQQVLDYFHFMSERGHCNFKLFMIFGYPWESVADFREFEDLMERVRGIGRKTAAHIRIKFTPFIPQPATPLGKEPARYNRYLKALIDVWLRKVKEPFRYPGWYIESDGIMSAANHALQCRLTSGDERVLLPYA